uniref:BRO1 domain-containing protein n=1 Tax=Mesocestoides corti TaxID=53468 RepID=A0A5K3FCY4_MESCO
MCDDEFSKCLFSKLPVALTAAARGGENPSVCTFIDPELLQNYCSSLSTVLENIYRKAMEISEAEGKCGQPLCWLHCRGTLAELTEEAARRGDVKLLAEEFKRGVTYYRRAHLLLQTILKHNARFHSLQ